MEQSTLVPVPEEAAQRRKTINPGTFPQCLVESRFIIDSVCRQAGTLLISRELVSFGYALVNWFVAWEVVRYAERKGSQRELTSHLPLYRHHSARGCHHAGSSLTRLPQRQTLCMLGTDWEGFQTLCLTLLYWGGAARRWARPAVSLLPKLLRAISLVEGWENLLEGVGRTFGRAGEGSGGKEALQCVLWVWEVAPPNEVGDLRGGGLREAWGRRARASEAMTQTRLLPGGAGMAVWCSCRETTTRWWVEKHLEGTTPTCQDGVGRKGRSIFNVVFSFYL